jgi:hypothetical protein
VTALCMTAFLILVVPLGLHAQIDTGSITGIVHDPSGAVIPGAKITLTNDATSVHLATVSTSTGNYVFSGLIPAT